MFFLSGTASLTLQVVWFKQLQFALGSSTWSVSVTVAAFFLGLALGGALGGRIADRALRPLRTYGRLELALGLSVPIITAALRAWPVWTTWIAGALTTGSPFAIPLTAAVAFAILLAPTCLMGATLPVLVRHLVVARAEVANRVGLLYGANTLGASFGTLTAGFLWIGALGVTGTAWLAAALYGLAGLAALALARGVAPASRSEAPELPVQRAGLVVAVCAASGLLSIAYEVVWFRVLRNFATPTVYAFSAMLGVYLLGLVVGAIVTARWISREKATLLRNFALVQAAIALAAVASLALLAIGPALRVLLDPRQLPLPAAFLDATDDALGFLLVTGVTLAVPTVLIGISFPLATELVTDRVGAVGGRVGALYAWNTLAGVAGSLAAGFVLVPVLGSQGALTLLACGNAALFVAIMAIEPRLSRDRRTWGSGLAMVGAAGICLLALGPAALRPALIPTHGRVLAFVESIDGTYLLAEHEDPGFPPFRQLIVNGISYANTIVTGRRYMSLLADLPILLHDGPSEVLVICVGTGTTVGAVSTHPDVTAVTAVDLSQTVFDLAPLFASTNERFHENPKVRRIVADGRHFLLGTDRSFDVLTFEPPPPSDAGVVNLYSEEFYRLARRRMRPGAILAQWIPVNEVGREAVPRMMLRALTREFPHVSLWMGNGRDGIALASDQALRIDPTALATRMAAPEIAPHLAAVGIDSVEDLLATFVAADGDLAPFLRDAPSVTDDRPRIEYFNLYPPGDIAYAEVRRGRRSIADHLSSPVDRARLDRSIAVVDAIGEARDAAAAKDWAEAARVARAGLALDPGNPYLAFVLRGLDTRWPAR
jgi:predicted membrane-bound spermidine synthase